MLARLLKHQANLIRKKKYFINKHQWRYFPILSCFQNIYICVCMARAPVLLIWFGLRSVLCCFIQLSSAYRHRPLVLPVSWIRFLLLVCGLRWLLWCAQSWYPPANMFPTTIILSPFPCTLPFDHKDGGKRGNSIDSTESIFLLENTFLFNKYALFIYCGIVTASHIM